MDTQEARTPEAGPNGNGDGPGKTAEQKEDERLLELLKEGKIGESQKNVAVKDLKAGRSMECLPYLYVGRELPINLALKASEDWYSEENPEVFNTAVFLLKCNGITVGKLETARRFFDVLPPEKELRRLVDGMDDAAFAAYLKEYKTSRDPVELSRRINGMEDVAKQIQKSVDQSAAVIAKMEQFLELAASPKRKPGQEIGAAGQENPQAGDSGEKEVTYEQTMKQNLELQKAGLQRVKKLYQSGEINEAQKNLANYHIMCGKAFETLPYLKPGVTLTINMVDDVAACMEAGMSADMLYAVLRQENISGAKLKILLEIYPNLPEKDELVKYIRDSESEEALRTALTEYKNRNDIEWVRAQLQEKEKQIRQMDNRTKEMEKELRMLKNPSGGEPENEDGSTPAGQTAPEGAGDRMPDSGTTAGKETGSAGQAEETSPESDGGGEETGSEGSGDPEKSGGQEETAEGGEPSALPASETPPVSENGKDEQKSIPFLKKLFPGFYRAEKKDAVQVWRKERVKEKHEKELRAEMKRTMEDLYAQDVIDEETFYIFAEIAFKEQRMDKKAASFLVTEMRNGVPFPLLCKVIKHVKDSGDWSSAARVLGELIRYQDAMSAQPVPAVV